MLIDGLKTGALWMRSRKRKHLIMEQTTHRSGVRGWVGLGVVLGCLAFEPREAKAYSVCPSACALVVAGVVFLPTLTFLSAEGIYAAQLRWFPVGWAVPELLYGGAMTALLSGVMANSGEPGALAPFVALYGWFTIHAVLSLALGDDDPQPDERPRPAPPRARIVAAPLEGGAWAGVSGYL
jgi:hypothetical protein